MHIEEPRESSLLDLMHDSPSLNSMCSSQDLRRHRCYATFEACTICGEKGLKGHVKLFGSTHEIPLQVVAWRFNMQRGESLEYIETPILDKAVILFGIGVFVNTHHNQHFEVWEVKITSLNTDLSGFGQLFIPNEKGKFVHDLQIVSFLT